MIELSNERYDEKTDEYVYDVTMDEEELKVFSKLAADKNMEVDEYLSCLIKQHFKEFLSSLASAKQEN